MVRVEARSGEADDIERSPRVELAPRGDDEQRRKLSDLMMAFDLALEAIKAPALLIGSDGHILRTNAMARANLAADAAPLRRSLALALTWAAHGRATAD